jgi:uncharacterized protein YecE (DUF72 family)
LLFYSSLGYCYSHWNGKYYPRGFGSSTRQFQFYSKEFDYVELNGTFFTPKWNPKIWQDWAKAASSVRPTFQFGMKVWQYFIHYKRLNIDSEFVEKWQKFYNNAQLLGSHRGPFLWQFKDSFECTEVLLDRLKSLGPVLRGTGPHVFELRHSSWYKEEVYQLLRENDWAICVLDLSNKPKQWCGDLSSGMWPKEEKYHRTSTKLVYYRFHGPSGQYEGEYSEKAMREYAKRGSKYIQQMKEQNNANKSKEHDNGSESNPMQFIPPREFDPNFTVYYAFNNTDNAPGVASAITNSRQVFQSFQQLHS